MTPVRKSTPTIESVDKVRLERRAHPRAMSGSKGIPGRKLFDAMKSRQQKERRLAQAKARTERELKGDPQRSFISREHTKIINLVESFKIYPNDVEKLSAEIAQVEKYIETVKETFAKKFSSDAKTFCPIGTCADRHKLIGHRGPHAFTPAKTTSQTTEKAIERFKRSFEETLRLRKEMKKLQEIDAMKSRQQKERRLAQAKARAARAERELEILEESL